MAKKLLILDDGFPSMATGFRIAEFSYYLKQHENSEVCSVVMDFDKMKAEYGRYYPDLIHKVRPVKANSDYSGALAYMIFLHNTFFFLPLIEFFQLPFVFTLCDGGFFHLDDEQSDTMLRTVFGSPYFRKVIIPINTIYDYVLRENFIPPDKAEFIEGVITQTDYWEQQLVPKRYYKKDKNTFDICFIAHKYKDKGTDKGYDTFVEIAKRLAPLSEDIRFHVVGGYDENELDITPIRNRIIFYGQQYQHFFPEFYSRMDVYLSLMSLDPARKLHPGRIAGVCNTTAVQTALNGTALFGIYEPEQLPGFTDRENVVLLPEDTDEIVKLVSLYFNNLEALYRLSACGQQKFREFYRQENPLKKRFNVLKHYLQK